MATITLPAKEVQAACKVTIEQILELRKIEDEKQITTAMKPMKVFGFNLWSKSREQSIKHLEEYRWGSFPCCNYGQQLQKAHKLLVLAQKGDPVTLNEEDCWVIF